MYELTTVFQEDEYGQMTSSVENYLKTIEYDKVTIAQTAMGLVNSLSSKFARQKSLTSQNALTKVWNTICGKNQRLSASIIEDEQKASTASIFLLQKMAERNYMGFELLATLGNRLNMITAMYSESIQDLSLDMNEFIQTVNGVFNSAKTKIIELDKRVEKLEQNVQLLKWKNTIEYQSLDGILYKELPVASRLLCLLTDYTKITGKSWDLYDLLLLKGAFADVGILGTTQITYRDIYITLFEQPHLCKNLLNAMQNESVQEESKLANYDIAFISLLKKIDSLLLTEKEKIETIVELTSSSAEKVAETILSKYTINELGINPDLSLKPFDFLLECLHNRRLILDQLEEKISYELVKKEYEAEEYDIVFPKLIELEKREHAAEIQFMIGECYDYGQGVQLDYVKAVEWYQLAKEPRDENDKGNSDAQLGLAYCYLNGEGVEENESEAFKWFLAAAEQGNADAQSNVGWFYRDGKSVEQDYEQAFSWYKLSAEQGDDVAQNNLGALYGDGNGVEQNYTEAATWYRKSAEQGNDVAQFFLGWLYEEGKGVTQDYSEAAKWFLKSAEQGNASAQYWLGVLYRNGNGVSQDYSEAAKWYRLSAEQGNASAQNKLGFLYQKGNGVPQNYAEAVKWYRKAAEQGDADAQFWLGSLFEKGKGVPQDYAEAAKWYRLSAEEGIAEAQFTLGWLYEEGKGVSQNYTEAAKWYRLSAEQGDATAQICLGALLRDGKGVEQNAVKAARWFKLSAEQEISTAAYCLAQLYENGNGVPRDKEEAKKWFHRAAELGDSDAADELNRLNKSTGQKILGAVGATLAVTGAIAAGAAGLMLGEPHLMAIESAIGEKYNFDSYQLEQIDTYHYQGRANVTKKGIFGTKGYFDVDAKSSSGLYLTWKVSLSSFHRDW